MRVRLGVASALFVGLVATRARGGVTGASHDARLEAELRDTILELRRSRARVAHVADTERKRIKRDLHDGCQQRLIALRVKLALAEEIVGGGNPPIGDLIQEIAADAKTALEDLHALVHGIYPALLSDRGLPDAAKHGGQSATARIAVWQGVEGLAFEVRDDGRGFDPRAAGRPRPREQWKTGSRPWLGASRWCRPECGAVVQGWVPGAALVS